MFVDTAAEELATLEAAFAQYKANTCITFVERPNAQQVNYVYIQKTGNGQVTKSMLLQNTLITH